MPKTKTLLLLILLGASTGCATQVSSPDLIQLHKLPKVRMGTTTGGHKDYVLFIPKRQAFPIEFDLTGDPLKGEIHEVIRATLKTDVYLYKNWMSYDGKSWQTLHQMLGLGLSLGMDNKKGFIKVELNKLSQ